MLFSLQQKHGRASILHRPKALRQGLFLYAPHAFDCRFPPKSLALGMELLRINDSYRYAAARIARALPASVRLETSSHVIRDAGVNAFIPAFEQIHIPHAFIIYDAVRVEKTIECARFFYLLKNGVFA